MHDVYYHTLITKYVNSLVNLTYYIDMI